METAIWKFPLELKDRQEIEMPGGAHILTIQMQNGVPCMWAIVVPETPTEKRKFITVGTGHPMPHELSAREYVGTWQGGAYVWHVFDLSYWPYDKSN